MIFLLFAVVILFVDMFLCLINCRMLVVPTLRQEQVFAKITKVHGSWLDIITRPMYNVKARVTF